MAVGGTAMEEKREMVFCHRGVERNDLWLCRPGGPITCLQAREASFLSGQTHSAADS